MHAADSTNPTSIPGVRTGVARSAALRAPGLGLPETAAWPTGAVLPETEATVQRRRRFFTARMRDLAIGAVVAAGLHAGIVILGEMNPAEATPAPAPALVEQYVPIEMPVLEPPEPVEVVDVSDVEAPPEFAPPSLMDVPSTVAVADFTQVMRPMLDPALTSVGKITIPTSATVFAQPVTGVRLFDLKDLDRVPRRLKTVMPLYPADMKRAGIMGEVILIVIIDPNGRVVVETVLHATNREFEQAAVKAAEQCVFESPLKAGQRVSARYQWHIPFELR